MLIAVLFARRIMRPLHALTVAARRFSRGEQGAPITPEGPSDIRELADSFNDMQYRLTRFVKDRMRMVASIGHDLRTPLTSLRIRAEFIDDPSLRQDIVSTVDEMTSLVEQTLQFAKDDAHQEPTREVDLAGLIAQVVAHHRAIGAPVDSRIAGPLRYRCRPVHLRRALDNLVGNAARHCRTRVEVSMDRAAGDIRIRVADDGPGIPPALLGQAFEPFVSLDPARSRKGGGGGLGLAIARSSIHAHGGEVTLDNRDEGGLVATVRLPA
nr:ATP-binding protein [Stenotrophomonas mori]